MAETSWTGHPVIAGAAAGPVLHADVGLSFWGGVDPVSGLVIDTHHPLHGRSVAGTVLALPSGRGSCSGSGVLFELLLNGRAPAALVFSHHEAILTLAVSLAAELFGIAIPVVQLDPADFAALGTQAYARVEGGTVEVAAPGAPARPLPLAPAPADPVAFELSADDRAVLAGVRGEAARLALRVVVTAARLEGATRLLDVERAHLDGVFYQGPASVRFVERLVELDGRVAVPTTMNALGVDRRRWRDQGVSPTVGEPSDRIADAYVALGVEPTYTCAPYQLAGPPVRGQQIAWAESNAVVYANSVIGARTLKYPDYLDVLVALVGRGPDAGPHTDAGRRATVEIGLDLALEHLDDAFFATLGYAVGALAPNDIPVVTGLAGCGATLDDLRAFGAAFATTSAAPMFHLVGLTPEATDRDAVIDPGDPPPVLTLGRAELSAAWSELDSADTTTTELIALGNPHFSLDEYARLAALCAGRTKAPTVDVVVTASRAVHAQAERAGHVAPLAAFGVRFVQDTCWCLFGEPVIAPRTRTIATTSAKYAHYGPAGVGRGFHLRGLAACVDTACTGVTTPIRPNWLD